MRSIRSMFAFWFQDGLEPSTELHGAAAVALLVVGDQSLAVVEPGVKGWLPLE